MNPNLPRPDQLLVDRYLDGALSADAAAELRRRLVAEPALRAALEERQGMRRGFAAGRDAVIVPPVDFADRVVAAVRRLPPASTEVGDLVARVCRGALLAAAAIMVAAALWHAGMFRSAGDGTIEAAPDEVQRVIDALDAKIQAAGSDGRK